MDTQPIALSDVLIVEDNLHAGRRLQQLVATLADDARIDVVETLDAARTRLQANAYTLALVDMCLPDGDGHALIGWMRTHCPDLAAVIVSSFAEEESVLAALRAGAVGYLLKERDDEELLMSLKSLQRGGAPIDPSIARRILALLSASDDAVVPPSAVPLLSPREQEIVQLVAQGFTNREIAELVALSRLTIESHVKNIYRKLAVGSRTEAVYEARARGLLK
ncbi:response regulator transcription factor [Pseudoxanthomonas sp. LjRoot143]|uniref:response regulator n=1 Tax=Pseudoxanthomonas sp. LjRoot143 TaxID=3342266 RepID=UPI003ED0447B